MNINTVELNKQTKNKQNKINKQKQIKKTKPYKKKCWKAGNENGMMKMFNPCMTRFQVNYKWRLNKELSLIATEKSP